METRHTCSAGATDSERIAALWQALYHSDMVGLFRSSDTRVVDANDSFLALIGYSREEMEAGEIPLGPLCPAEVDGQREGEAGRLPCGMPLKPFEKDYVRKDGARVALEIQSTILSSDPRELISLVIDRTERRRALESEQALKAIVEHAPVGVMIVDATGTMTFMNETGQLISKMAPSQDLPVAEQARAYQVRDAKLGRLLAPEETPIGLAVAGETVTGFEYVIRPQTSSTDIWVRAAATPLPAVDGYSGGAVAIFEDLTKERMREHAKDTFLSAAAHDLRQPLTGIMGWIQMMERDLETRGSLTAEETMDRLQRIGQTALRMNDLITEFLDVARLQAGENLELVLGRVDLVELVRRVVREVAQAIQDHEVRIETTEAVLWGSWDELRLARAIENLIRNSIQYSPGINSVTVSLSREWREGRDWAVIQVRDQGIGISQRDLPKIFERYYRGGNVVGQFRGTGIGLAAVKQVVEQHGGRVEVQSREGEGSTFTVRLPALPD